MPWWGRLGGGRLGPRLRLGSKRLLPAGMQRTTPYVEHVPGSGSESAGVFIATWKVDDAWRWQKAAFSVGGDGGDGGDGSSGGRDSTTVVVQLRGGNAYFKPPPAVPVATLPQALKSGLSPAPVTVPPSACMCGCDP